MKKKIALYLILGCSFFLLTSTAFGQKLLSIPEASEPPIIDGVKDTMWYFIPENDLRQASFLGGTTDGWLDLFATFRVMYDSENLYILGSVYDDSINASNPTSIENDGFEVFLDGNNSKEQSYDGIDDIQLRFNYGIQSTSEIVYNTGGLYEPNLSLITFAQDTIKFGWMIEIVIPFSILNNLVPEVNKQIGFDLQYNDNDTGVRDNAAKWNAIDNDGSSNNSSLHGTLAITDREIYTHHLDVSYTSTPPVIDGIEDDLWKGVPRISNNYYIEFDETFADLTDENDCRFFVRTLWDDDFIYVFADIMDDIIRADHEQIWQNDGLEVYFDGDNSKSSEGYDSINDAQIRWNYGITSTDEITGWNELDPPPDYSPVEFAQQTIENGWTLEIAFPVYVINLIGLYLGQEIGFEVQVNENDIGSRGFATKIWHDTDGHRPNVFGTALLVEERITNVQKSDLSSVPMTMYLSQNYPNPFNTRTNICYSITEPCKVTLTVFNLLGNHVATLVDENKSPGIYTADFDASQLPSGIYVYKLQAGNMDQTRKMLYVR